VLKQLPTLFLRTIILLSGLAVFWGMIRFPQTEGRAINLDIISIYTDPFIVYIYIASIPFFVALYQAFKILGYVDQNKIFSQASVNALKNIKYCGGVIIAFILAAEAYLFIFQRSNSDDPAGGVMMGVFIIFISLTVLASADIFEKIIQKAIAK
jgi:hypothetical protein